jgi:hypothetical protein
MEHWFDRLTKSMATARFSRRSVLQGAAAVGGSWILSRAAGPAALASAQVRLKPLVNPPTCEIETKGGDAVITYSARSSYRDQPLTLTGIQARRGRRYPTVQSQMRVEIGGKLVMDFNRSITPTLDAHARRTTPTVRTNITYGDPIGGVRSVTAVAKGNQIQGFADGRAFTADRAPQAALRFKNPRRQATIRVDPDLAQAMQELVATANRNLQNCPVRRASMSSLHDVASRSDVILKPVRALASSLASAGVVASMAAQNIPSQGPCDDCLYACDKNFVGCMVGCAKSLGLDCWGGIKCGEDLNSCGDDCNKPGGPCCDVGCPGGGCCAKDTTCCGNTCCDSGSTTCATAKDGVGDTVHHCCPSSAPSLQILGYQYSQQDVNETLEIVCCPNGTTGCSGNSCCSSDQYCADHLWGICCRKGQSFCAGYCCDGTCVKTAAGSETCCPRGSLCGSDCCSSDEKCLQSPGGPICCNGYLCGSQCCGPGAICSNGQCFYGSPCGNTHCGLANPVCCNGVCCSSNQTCVNGRCTGTQCPTYGGGWFRMQEVPCPDTPGMCCPWNTECCASVKQCCAPGTECCGARGCVPTGMCVQ